MKLTKKGLDLIIHQKLNMQLTALNEQINAVTKARNDDTKSSAGDKFETGRARMQQQLDQLLNQQSRIQQQVLLLNSISTPNNNIHVSQGSLVETDTGIYYMSIGLGKLTIEDQMVFIISNESPIGKLLFHKKVGQEIIFNNKKSTIIKIN